MADTLPPPRPGRLRGPSFRLGQVTHVFDYLPPMVLQGIDELGRLGPEIPVCGRCFRQLGDDPFNGAAGQMRPLRIENNRRCFRCGRRCHPCD